MCETSQQGLIVAYLKKFSIEFCCNFCMYPKSRFFQELVAYRLIQMGSWKSVPIVICGFKTMNLLVNNKCQA